MPLETSNPPAAPALQPAAQPALQPAPQPARQLVPQPASPVVARAPSDDAAARKAERRAKRMAEADAIAKAEADMTNCRVLVEVFGHAPGAILRLTPAQVKEAGDKVRPAEPSELAILGTSPPTVA